MRDLVEGVLEDEREQEVSLVGSRGESSKRGRVGDQETAVVPKWQRRDAGLPYEKGASLEGDGGREANRAG